MIKSCFYPSLITLLLLMTFENIVVLGNSIVLQQIQTDRDGRSFSFPISFSDYQKKRKELIQKDEEKRNFYPMHMTHIENQAATAFNNLIQQEKTEFYSQEEFPPSMPFSKAKSLIESSPQLFSLIKEMPKGALLHIHDGSTGDHEYLVQSTYLPNCYLNGDDNALIRIKFFKEKPAEGNWTSFNEIRQNVKDVHQFDQYIAKSLTISGDKLTETLDAVWAQFQNIFYFQGGLVTYIPVFKSYYYKALKDIAQSGINHVEFRVVFSILLYDLERTYHYEEIGLRLLKEIEEKIQLEFPFFLLKVILTDARGNDVDFIKSSLLRAVAVYNSQEEEQVVAYDLVGQEDKGHSLEYFYETIAQITKETTEKGLKMPPFVFHSGETVKESVANNLYDAVLFGAKRIGHGYALPRFPTLVEEIKKNNVAIEVCPLSNQLLRLLDDLRNHPAIHLISSGVPVVIASDDPGAFGYNSINYDWFQAILGWELTFKDIKRLIMNSIEHSLVNSQEKRRLLENWHHEWIEFCTQIVSSI